MDLHIRFSFDSPRGATRRIAMFVALPVALVMAAGLAAYAYETTWIANGQQLSAAKLKSLLDEGLVPAGTMVAYGGSAAPPFWVLCDGSTYDKTSPTYAGLGAALAGC